MEFSGGTALPDGNQCVVERNMSKRDLEAEYLTIRRRSTQVRQRTRRGDEYVQRLIDTGEVTRDEAAGMRSLDPGYNRMLRHFSSEAEAAIRDRWSFDETVFVGEIITGEVNANVHRARNGFIVLINDGLLLFAHQICVLAGLSCDPAARNAARVTELARCVEETVLAYVERGDSTYAHRPDYPLGRIGNVVATVRNVCEMFVVAHEYGHILGGHLDRANTRALPGSPDVKVIEKNWSEEFEADEYGANIMSQWGTKSGHHPKAVIGGCMFALFLLLAIDRIRAKRDGVPFEDPGSESHPPVLNRIERLGDHFATLTSAELVGASNVFGTQLLMLTDEICGETLNVR